MVLVKDTRQQDKKPTYHTAKAPTRSASGERLPIEEAWDFIRKTLKQPSKHSRSRYWLLWLVLTVMMAIAAVTGSIGSIFGGLVSAALCGLYTYYLYNGGRFVIVPTGVMYVLLLIPVVLIVHPFISGDKPGGSSGYMTCQEFMSLDGQSQYNEIARILVTEYDLGSYSSPVVSQELVNIETMCESAPPDRLVGEGGV